MAHMHMHMDKNVAAASAATSKDQQQQNNTAAVGFIQTAPDADEAGVEETNQQSASQQAAATTLLADGTNLFMDFTAAKVMSATPAAGLSQGADDVTDDVNGADDVTAVTTGPLQLTGAQVMAEAVRQLGEDALMAADSEDDFDPELSSTDDAALATVAALGMSSVPAADGGDVAMAPVPVSVPDAVNQSNGLMFAQQSLPADVTAQMSELINDVASKTFDQQAAFIEMPPELTSAAAASAATDVQNGTYTPNMDQDTCSTPVTMTTTAELLSVVNQHQQKPVDSSSSNDDFYSLRAIQELQKLAAEQHLPVNDGGDDVIAPVGETSLLPTDDAPS